MKQRFLHFNIPKRNWFLSLISPSEESDQQKDAFIELIL